MNRFFSIVSVLLYISIFNTPYAQEAAALTSMSTSKAKMEIAGTSTVHDWEMTAASGNCTAQLSVNGTSVSSISSMKFSINVADLKSGKGPMDTNAYKALKSKEHPKISAEWVSGTVSGGNFKGKVKLTIAGTTKETNLEGTISANASGTVTVKGSKSINMVEYGVVPPSFAFGAMKTGKDVVISFNLVLTK